MAGRAQRNGCYGAYTERVDNAPVVGLQESA
jgi:hypothetical protein